MKIQIVQKVWDLIPLGAKEAESLKSLKEKNKNVENR